MKYQVRIDGALHEVIVDGETIVVNGRTVRAHIEDLPGTPLQQLVIGQRVHRVLARRGTDREQYELSIGGHRFVVEALDERTRAIRELSATSVRVSGPSHLTAPMPGLIVRVNVGAGDVVHAGQGLVVMEAMKMENELRASVNGTVKRVVVAPGSAVERGTVLLEMELQP